MERNDSLKVNMVLNAINSILSIIFPLVTFPYISKILGVEVLGQYNFCLSIISYASLLAGLGISTYAIREGAKYKNDLKNLSKFSSQMYSINMYSTICAYIILGTIVFCWDDLEMYRTLIFILSIQIIFKTMGVDWLYTIKEKFLLKTIRSIVTYLISIILLFLFVKTRRDLYKYAIITVVASSGTELFNFFYAKKMCDFRFTFKINWKMHIKPILVIFAMAISTTIYVSSDTTLLGILANNYEVGIYTVSAKIYSLVKGVISAVLVAALPRMAYQKNKSDYQVYRMLSLDVYSTMLSFSIPAMIGIIFLRNEIVLLISDTEYLEAANSLVILAVALVFCMGAAFWGQAVLIVNKMENILFIITVISAGINIVLNLVLIPIWGHMAAALTTLVSEAFSYLACKYYGKKILKISEIKKVIVKIIIGCSIIPITYWAVNSLVINELFKLMFTIGGASIAYILIEIALKNQAIISFVFGIKKRMNK